MAPFSFGPLLALHAAQQRTTLYNLFQTLSYIGKDVRRVTEVINDRRGIVLMLSDRFGVDNMTNEESNVSESDTENKRGAPYVLLMRIPIESFSFDAWRDFLQNM